MRNQRQTLKTGKPSLAICKRLRIAAATGARGGPGLAFCPRRMAVSRTFVLVATVAHLFYTLTFHAARILARRRARALGEELVKGGYIPLYLGVNFIF